MFKNIKTPADKVSFSRHPDDLIRFFSGLFLFLFSFLMALSVNLTTFEIDFFRLFNHLPLIIGFFLMAVMQLGAYASVFFVSILSLLARQFRLALFIFSGGTFTWLAVKIIKFIVLRARPSFLIEGVIIHEAHLTESGFPSGHAAVAGLIATLVAPYLNKRGRRVLWLLVWLVGIARIYVGAHFPLDVIGGVMLGWTIGSGMNLIWGSIKIQPSPQKIKLAMKKAGLKLTRVNLAQVDARGSVPFYAETPRKKGLFIKVVGQEQRTADWFFKLGRRLLFREIEDEAPFVSAKQQIEHEAFMTLLAQRAKVNVPPIILTTQIGQRTNLLVEERLFGQNLARINKQKIDDRLLRQIWQQISLLRRARLAHRDLRRANVIVDTTGQPWLIDFGFAETAASDRRLALDIAEMSVSLALIVGAQRALKTLVDVLGKKPLVTALPFIQPLSLSSVTRKELKKQPDLIDELRQLASQMTHSRLTPPEPLTRIRRYHLVWLLVFALAIHLLLPQVGELEKSLTVLQSAQWNWLMIAGLSTFLSYLMATLAQMGATDSPLSFGRTLLAITASSFVNRFAPHGFGGVVLTERYLEKSGLTRSSAIAAIALNRTVGFVIFTPIGLITLSLLGQSTFPEISIPKNWSLLIFFIFLMIILGLFSQMRSIRLRILVPSLKALKELATVFRDPTRLIQLFGGSFASIFFDFLTLVICLKAFGGNLSLIKILGVYLGSAAIGSVSPTPNGLGAIEASLVAGLSGLGMEIGPAIAGSLAFRLITFWLPILPGYFTFHFLSRRRFI